MSTVPSLGARIRRLYDDTTPGWVEVWGEHLHHGHYGPRGDEGKDHLQAQVDMVDAVLAWGQGSDTGGVERILDAGCGVGGSARHLADRFGARVDGLTLSPVQRDLAERLSSGRSDVRFRVMDVTTTDYPDGTFDLVWALESGEHMPDKEAFVRECVRVLRPGGRLIAATWCHRPVPPALTEKERRRLDRVSRAYGDSLTWVTLAEYRAIAERLGLRGFRAEDWSSAVAPFWSAVLRSVLTPGGLRALVGGGRSMLTGAWGGLHMRAGLREDLVRYVVFTAKKPEVGA